MQFEADKGIMSKVYNDSVYIIHCNCCEQGHKVTIPARDNVTKDILSLPRYPKMPNKNMKTAVCAVTEHHVVK
jgi:dTDP-4-amino-4,6-dideoxygalactose transaminase